MTFGTASPAVSVVLPVYNGATYLLSAILQRLTGQTVLDYLRPRLLEPLGVTDATWSTCPRGITIGAWGLNLRDREAGAQRQS